MLDPFISDLPPEGEIWEPKTMVRFCKAAPIIITGDMGGTVNIYRLFGYEDSNLKE